MFRLRHENEFRSLACTRLILRISRLAVLRISLIEWMKMWWMNVWEREEKKKRKSSQLFNTFELFSQGFCGWTFARPRLYATCSACWFLSYLVSSLSVHTKMFLYFYRKYVGIVVAYLPTQGFKHWLRGPIRSSALASPNGTNRKNDALKFWKSWFLPVCIVFCFFSGRLLCWGELMAFSIFIIASGTLRRAERSEGATKRRTCADAHRNSW